MQNTRRNKLIRKQVTRSWLMLQLQTRNTAKSFGTQHFPPHYMNSELLINQSLQEGVSLERQRMLQLEYSLTVEVPRVLRERMLTLFISTKHLHWIVAANYRQANGFGMYDCFCTKKGCSVKAHLKSKFIPETSLFFASGSNDSAFCCHFVCGLNGQRNHNLMTLQKWIEAMEQMTSKVSVLIQLSLVW